MKKIFFILAVLNSYISTAQEISTGQILEPAVFIYNLDGINLSQKEFVSIDLNENQVKKAKWYKMKCENYDGCVDTVLVEMKLKSFYEVDNRLLTTRQEKLLFLSDIGSDNIDTIKNLLLPNKMYKGVFAKHGVVKIILKE